MQTRNKPSNLGSRAATTKDGDIKTPHKQRLILSFPSSIRGLVTLWTTLQHWTLSFFVHQLSQGLSISLCYQRPYQQQKLFFFWGGGFILSPSFFPPLVSLSLRCHEYNILKFCDTLLAACPAQTFCDSTGSANWCSASWNYFEHIRHINNDGLSGIKHTHCAVTAIYVNSTKHLSAARQQQQGGWFLIYLSCLMQQLNDLLLKLQSHTRTDRQTAGSSNTDDTQADTHDRQTDRHTWQTDSRQ